jgi:hypothetical protein
VTRRHKDVFKVTVPKDFGNQTLVWKLTSHGRTDQVVATLKPVWQIDRLRTTRGGNSENVSSNLPPQVNVFVSNKTATGATLTVMATDDGLPKRRGESVGMTVLWAKYRGPGSVQFADAQTKLVNGKATTIATFSEPGDYILQSVVDDGSGESAGNFGYHCCWTNTQAKISVSGGSTTTTARTSPAPAKSATPTFAKDVAPIFQKELSGLSPSGHVRPMSLVSYEEVRPWARAIRQRVANREMPPWHLDKTVGIRHYKNDRSLSDDEIATVVRWADNGAPMGNPTDMPKPLTFRPEGEWFIGEPDLKVTTPNDFTMYSNGPDWWIDQYADVEITEDRWIKAMEIKPSNPKIVHHVVIYVIEPDAPEGTPKPASSSTSTRSASTATSTARTPAGCSRRARVFATTCITSPSAPNSTTRRRWRSSSIRRGSRRSIRCGRRRFATSRTTISKCRPTPSSAPTATSGSRGRRASTPFSRTCTCAGRA